MNSGKLLAVLKRNKNVRLTIATAALLITSLVTQAIASDILRVIAVSLVVGCAFVLPVLIIVSIFSVAKQWKNSKSAGYIPQEEPQIAASYYGKRALFSLLLAVPGVVVSIMLSSMAKNGASGTEFIAFGLLPLFFLVPASVVGSILFTIAYLVKKHKENKEPFSTPQNSLK